METKKKEEVRNITITIPRELDFMLQKYLLSLREGGEYNLTKTALIIRLIRRGAAEEVENKNKRKKR